MLTEIMNVTSAMSWADLRLSVPCSNLNREQKADHMLKY